MPAGRGRSWKEKEGGISTHTGVASYKHNHITYVLHFQPEDLPEGECPGLLPCLALVDGVEVYGGLLLGLAAAEEADAGDGGGDGAREGEDCGLGDRRRMRWR